MVDYISEANKPNAKHHVISAKITESLFDNIEGFRNDQNYSCRNDAIFILIALGLDVLGRIPKEDLQQYLEEYRIDLHEGGSS